MATAPAVSLFFVVIEIHASQLRAGAIGLESVLSYLLLRLEDRIDASGNDAQARNSTTNTISMIAFQDHRY